MDPASLAAIFQAAELTQRVAALYGMTDNLDPQIDKLAKSELAAGARALQQARDSVSEQASLLREARDHFNKAVTLEAGQRKAEALLGLAACHHALGDELNCRNALSEILEIEPMSTLGMATAMGRGMASAIGKSALEGVKMPTSISQVANAVNPLRAVTAAVKTVGALSTLTSGDARRAMLTKQYVDAIATSPEAKAIVGLQDAVSVYIGAPIPWVKRLAEQ